MGILTLNFESIFLYATIFEFEKWRAIRASVGGVDSVLTWVVC